MIEYFVKIKKVYVFVDVKVVDCLLLCLVYLVKYGLDKYLALIGELGDIKIMNEYLRKLV